MSVPENEATSGARVPATLPVMVLLRTASGSPLEAEVRPALTRDVNDGGLGLEVPGLPEALASAISAAGKLRVDMDVRVRGHTLRLAGETTWLRVVERKGVRVAVLGVQYTDVSSENAQALTRLVRRRAARASAWRLVALATASLAIVGGLAYWRLHVGSAERIASVEQELTSARASEQLSKSELVLSAEALAALRVTLVERESAVTRRERELENARVELAYARERVRALSGMLDDWARIPPDGLEQSAAYHLERGRLFWERNNEAASLLEFEQAVAIEPSLGAAHRELAEANDYFGRYERAIAGYRRYLELSPRAADAGDIAKTIEELQSKLPGQGRP